MEARKKYIKAEKPKPNKFSDDTKNKIEKKTIEGKQDADNIICTYNKYQRREW